MNSKRKRNRKRIPKQSRKMRQRQANPRSYLEVGASRIVRNNTGIIDRFSRRREKVANISGTTLFTVNQQFYLNPGNSILFPVFSQIAATYEEWRCKYLALSFESEAYSSIGTTASAGKVILVTNFDPNDANFSSSNQAENYDHSVRTLSYQSATHIVESKNANLRGFDPLKTYYINSSPNLIAPTSDTNSGKFFDLGNFQLITESNGSTNEIGELYVEYEFELIRPKQQTPIGQNNLTAHYVGTATTANSLTSMVSRAGSNLVVTFTNGLNFTIPNPGRYLINYLAFAGTSYTGSGITAGTGATLLTILNNNGSNSTNSGSTTTQFISTVVVDITAANGIITFPSPTIVGTTQVDLFITQVPGGLTLYKKKVEQLEDKLNALMHYVNHLADEKVDFVDDLYVDTNLPSHRERELHRSSNKFLYRSNSN